MKKALVCYGKLDGFESDSYADVPKLKYQVEDLISCLSENGLWDLTSHELTTLEDLKKTLKDETSALDANDNFLFYYLGHGFEKSNIFYIVGAEELEINLSDAFVVTSIDATSSIIIDACQSKTFIDSWEGKKAEVFVSTQGDYSHMHDETGKSLFTKKFIDIVKKETLTGSGLALNDISLKLKTIKVQDKRAQLTLYEELPNNNQQINYPMIANSNNFQNIYQCIFRHYPSLHELKNVLLRIIPLSFPLRETVQEYKNYLDLVAYMIYEQQGFCYCLLEDKQNECSEIEKFLTDNKRLEGCEEQRVLLAVGLIEGDEVSENCEVFEVYANKIEREIKDNTDEKKKDFFSRALDMPYTGTLVCYYIGDLSHVNETYNLHISKVVRGKAMQKPLSESYHIHYKDKYRYKNYSQELAELINWKYKMNELCEMENTLRDKILHVDTAIPTFPTNNRYLGYVTDRCIDNPTLQDDLYKYGVGLAILRRKEGVGTYDFCSQTTDLCSFKFDDLHTRVGEIGYVNQDFMVMYDHYNYPISQLVKEQQYTQEGA